MGSGPGGSELGPNGWIVPPQPTPGVAFPVGALFLSVVPTNPAVLLGYGSWSELAGGFALVTVDLEDDDLDAAENTGGAEEGTPAGSVSQPTFTGAPLGTHAHGAGTLLPNAHSGAGVADHAAHTHAVTSNVAVGDHASHTHTYTQVPNHVHVENVQGGTTASTTGTHIMTSASTGGSLRQAATSTQNPTGGVATGTTNGPSATLTHSVTNNAVTSGNPSAPLTHSVTQPSNHTMSGSSEAVTGGTPAGTVSQPNFTGSPMSLRPPSIAVHVWKRTA